MVIYVAASNVQARLFVECSTQKPWIHNIGNNLLLEIADLVDSMRLERPAKRRCMRHSITAGNICSTYIKGSWGEHAAMRQLFQKNTVLVETKPIPR